MGNTWVIAMHHFSDVREISNPHTTPEARRIGEYFGSIVEAASTWNVVGIPKDSAIRCRRRPGHRPCPGHIRFLREANDSIEWTCSSCDDNGVITEWKGTPWDLSHIEWDDDDGSDEVSCVLTPDEYRAIESSVLIDEEATRTLRAAFTSAEGIRITGCGQEMEHLMDWVAAEANHESDRRRRLMLHRAFLKLDAALTR